MKRKPKYRGTGIYVHSQFQPKQLVKGDTFFDADYGLMKWTGKKWKSVSEKQESKILKYNIARRMGATKKQAKIYSK